MTKVSDLIRSMNDEQLAKILYRWGHGMGTFESEERVLNFLKKEVEDDFLNS